jgi:hypothetical protein
LVACDGVQVEVFDAIDVNTVRLSDVLSIAIDVVECLADAGALEYVFETRAVSVRGRECQVSERENVDKIDGVA